MNFFFIKFTWHAAAATHATGHSTRHPTGHATAAASARRVSFRLLLRALLGRLLLGRCQLGFLGRLRFGQPFFGILFSQRL